MRGGLNGRFEGVWTSGKFLYRLQMDAGLKTSLVRPESFELLEE
jgi:hypothetical protein